jgi:hypothetical protein
VDLGTGAGLAQGHREGEYGGQRRARREASRRDFVRRDFGARVVNQVARRMVVPAHRPGGQRSTSTSVRETSVRELDCLVRARRR